MANVIKLHIKPLTAKHLMKSPVPTISELVETDHRHCVYANEDRTQMMMEYLQYEKESESCPTPIC